MRPTVGAGDRASAVSMILNASPVPHARSCRANVPSGRRAGVLAALRGVLCFAVLIALTSCGQPKGTVKGKPPKGEPCSVVAVLAGDTPSTVTIRGKLVEKCPVAGCWFRLQDGAREIKVDTKTAGFVVTDIPLQTLLTVSGKVGQEGDETILEASGLRY